MIIPGYIAGLGCLFLITYRTLIAFFSETKAVTIYIDRFGEQFLDLFALIVIWIICLLGFLILIRFLREEKEKDIFSDNIDRRLILKKDNTFFDVKHEFDVEATTGESMGITAKLPKDVKQN
jgi:hypothetical protein